MNSERKWRIKKLQRYHDPQNWHVKILYTFTAYRKKWKVFIMLGKLCELFLSVFLVYRHGNFVNKHSVLPWFSCCFFGWGFCIFIVFLTTSHGAHISVILFCRSYKCYLLVIISNNASKENNRIILRNCSGWRNSWRGGGLLRMECFTFNYFYPSSYFLFGSPLF